MARAGKKRSKGIKVDKVSKKQRKNEDAKVSVQSLDDFMNTWSDADDDEYETKKTVNGTTNGHASKNHIEEDVDEEVEEDEADSDDDEALDTANREYMAKLAEKDPETFAYLKENDADLLNFDASEDEASENEESGAHQLPDSLEADSDDSDLDEDTEPQTKSSSKMPAQKLSKAKLQEWAKQCESAPSISLLQNLTNELGKALNALSLSASSKMSGSLFNSVVKLCLNNFGSVLRKVLSVSPSCSSAKKLGSSKKFKAVHKVLKVYTTHLITLTSSLSSSSAVSAVLSTLTPQQMLPFFTLLPKQRKQLLKALVKRWSQQDGKDDADDINSEVRLSAFVSIVHLVRASINNEDEDDDDVAFFERTVKSMHSAYLRNSKFTSPSTYPFIHFMRRSLSELMLLQPRSTYTMAFVFIRQLAIHVRNALVHNKKEQIQLIANWQFVHALHLWTHTLALTKENKESKQLRSLVYPLTQVINATCSVLCANKYDPLRFHLCSMLTEIGAGTSVYVPALPIYIEVLMRDNLGSKMGTKVSMRPVDFTCILRLSKAQMEENGTRDAVIQHLHDGIVEHLWLCTGNSIAFPELIVPLVTGIKRFLKKCKVANYARKLKTLVEHIEKHATFVAERRNKANIGLNDYDSIKEFEMKLSQEENSPIMKYFEPLKQKREEQVLSGKKKDKSLSFDHLLPRVEKKKTKKVVDEDEDFSLFGKDDAEEEQDDLDEMFKLKEERNKSNEDNEEDDENDDEDEDEDEMAEMEDEEDVDGEDDVVEELKEEDLSTDEDEDENDGEDDEDDDDDDDDDDE